MKYQVGDYIEYFGNSKYCVGIIIAKNSLYKTYTIDPLVSYHQYVIRVQDHVRSIDLTSLDRLVLGL